MTRKIAAAGKDREGAKKPESAKRGGGARKVSRAAAMRAKREAAMFAGPELSPEAEEAAEKICARIEEKVQSAVKQMVRRLMKRAPEELLGPGEFELRDGLHRMGALLVEEAVNERATSKKGVPGC
jgi:hypothetical protein